MGCGARKKVGQTRNKPKMPFRISEPVVGSRLSATMAGSADPALGSAAFQTGIGSFPRRRESILGCRAQKNVAETRKKPDKSFRSNKQLPGGGGRLPVLGIPATQGEQLFALARLRATCVSPDSPATTSCLLAVAHWLGHPPPPLFSRKSNPTSPLESAKRCKNEPKTNPKRTQTWPRRAHGAPSPELWRVGDQAPLHPERGKMA